jgi:branched-chain amino acid transport system substrate-binding protein
VVYNADAYEVKPLLAKLMAKDPDVVFLVSYDMDAAYIVREAKEIGLDPRLFIGGTSVFTRPEFQESAGDASEHIVTPDLWACSVPYPGAMEYCNSYRAKYGRPPDYHGAQAYASIYVIADAVKRVGVLSPIALRDALTQSDTRTVFGPVKFVSHGKKARQNMPPTLLTQWINGRLETIWPRDIASARYILPKAQ